MAARTRTLLRNLGEALLDGLLPSLCPLCCSAPGPGLCLACSASMEAIRWPCPRCGSARSDSEADCPACRGRGLPGIRSIQVRWRYAGPLAALIRRGKVNGDTAALAAAASLLPLDLPQAIDAVVPIPASPGRRDGPHLASWLAQHAAVAVQRPLHQVLRHQRPAAAQHDLPLSARRRNARELFACIDAVPPRLLLVDDLVTSGHTAQAAARALRQSGARMVHLLALARTGRPQEHAADARRDPAGHPP